MVTTRSRAPNGVPLLVLKDKKQVATTQPAVWLQQMPSDSSHDDGARILTMPPEIRNRIYKFCVSSDIPEKLADLKLPAIVFTCRQIRDEALPVLFAENTFVINLCMDGGLAVATASRLGLSRTIRRLILALKDRALFRHVKFEVNRGFWVKGWTTIDFKEGSYQFSDDISHQACNSTVKPLVSNFRLVRFPAAIERVKAFMQNLTSTDSGKLKKGLSISNLDSIAACFKMK